jgi:hypothetical protein
MKRNTLAWLFGVALLAIPAAAQTSEGYLDIYVAKVKLGKRMDFDALNKKEVEMNRKKGDHWTAWEVVYGDSNAVYFVSPRPTFAAAAEGIKAFEDAAKRSAGELGARKLFDDFDATAESEHDSLYRRRVDLSANAPANMAAQNKLVGEARWIRLVTVRTRPGKILAYEAELRRNKEANERMNPGIPFLVSQSVAGAAPGTFQTANLLKSLGDMDNIKQLQQVRGDSYASYQKTLEEAVERVDIVIGRYVPELSNPPDDVAAVDPAFWHPKPAATAAAKPKAAPKQ